MKFLRELTLEQRAGIHFVAGDGACWIDDCINEMLPNAKRCIDAFHVVQWVNDALDQQRRETWRELRQQAADLKKPSENPEETAEREELAKNTASWHKP